MNWYAEALRKYAQFSGRSRRKEYWYFVLFYMIIAFIIAIICGFAGNLLLYYIYIAGMIIPALAVGVRRMHDVGKSGWFLIIPIYSLILACTDGTHGPNEYGPDPKGNVEYGAADYEKPFDINTQQ